MARADHFAVAEFFIDLHSFFLSPPARNGGAGAAQRATDNSQFGAFSRLACS